MFWNPGSPQPVERFPSGSPNPGGQYVGASPQHAENIVLVRNLKTGYLSPQFHVVFGDCFETVHSGQDMDPNKWEDMCVFQQWETVFDEGTVPPKLKDEWLTPEEIAQPKSSHSTTQEEATRRCLYHDLLSKESRNDMSFKMPQ
jgi:hypothetical protein